MGERGLKVVTHEEVAETREQAIAKGAMSSLTEAGTMDVQVDLSRATKIPYGELTAFGAAFASISNAFRTVTQTVEVSGEGLYRVTDEVGNILNTNVLFKFGDGSGYLGSFRDAAGKLHQARINPVGPQVAEVATSMPYDPTALFMAAALMEVNQKLDAIQETQQQMFDYLKSREKGKLQANLEQLAEVMQNYRFYCTDREQMRSQRNLVVGIRKEAKEAIRHHQLVIVGLLKRAGAIHTDKEIRDKTSAVRSEFEEYRVAVYLYAFSTFLDVMLHGNFEEDYLAAMIEKLEDESIGYRQLYTQAYDLIEADADSSVRAMALGGLSDAMGFLSRAIEKTPVGDHTLIDEALDGASKGIGGFSKGMKDDMMGNLIEASSSDVRPFIENIEKVSHLYNDPVLLLADEDAVYVLPGSATNLENQVA